MLSSVATCAKAESNINNELVNWSQDADKIVGYGCTPNAKASVTAREWVVGKVWGGQRETNGGRLGFDRQPKQLRNYYKLGLPE